MHFAGSLRPAVQALRLFPEPLAPQRSATEQSPRRPQPSPPSAWQLCSSPTPALQPAGTLVFRRFWFGCTPPWPGRWSTRYRASMLLCWRDLSTHCHIRQAEVLLPLHGLLQHMRLSPPHTAAGGPDRDSHQPAARYQKLRLVALGRPRFMPPGGNSCLTTGTVCNSSFK